MSFEIETKHDMAARVELVRERIRQGHTASHPTPIETTDVPSEVLNAWQTALPPGDDLAKYLSLSVWPADEPLPSWIATIDALTQYVLQAYEHPEEVPTREEIPFVHIWWSIAEFARHHLLDVDVPAFVCQPSMIDLQMWLVSRLQTLGAQALHVDFMHYIGEHDATVLTDAFEQTGLEAVRDRLRQLSATDLQRQQSLIRASLHDRSVGDIPV